MPRAIVGSPYAHHCPSPTTCETCNPSIDPEAIAALQELENEKLERHQRQVWITASMIQSMDVGEYARIRPVLLKRLEVVVSCKDAFGCPYADIGVYICSQVCMWPCSADLFELPQ